MEGPSWLRETLKIWLQYLAVGMITALIAYIHFARPEHSRPAFVWTAILTGVCACIAWLMVYLLFFLREIRREDELERRRGGLFPLADNELADFGVTGNGG